jgi:parallel beta-helix repeat protein
MVNDIWDQQNPNINHNTITNCNYGISLYGWGNNYATISYNKISGGYCGIYLISANNFDVTNNIIQECDVGSMMTASKNCVISKNLFYNNNIGMSIIFPIYQNTHLYYNDFIDNAVQVKCFLITSQTWDGGNGRGNFWSDYSGLDDGSNGRTANDGIGDTAIPHQGVDNYPLMKVENGEHLVVNIIDMVKDLNLDNGIDNSLDSKLQNAMDSLSSLKSNNRNDAINKLEAFISEVEAQSGNKIPTADAYELIAFAQSIIDNI